MLLNWSKEDVERAIKTNIAKGEERLVIATGFNDSKNDEDIMEWVAEMGYSAAHYPLYDRIDIDLVKIEERSLWKAIEELATQDAVINGYMFLYRQNKLSKESMLQKLVITLADQKKDLTNELILCTQQKRGNQ